MARARAAEVLVRVMDQGASLDAALHAHEGEVADTQRALFRELCYGASRWYWRYRGVVDQLVKRPLKQRDRVIEGLMIVGLYQLDQLRLPAHAAIHASVEACSMLKRPAFKGLVNGVLRNFQRRPEQLLEVLGDCARDAHPQWLWERIQDQWPDHVAAIVDANNHRPPMMLRVNTRVLTVAEYLQELVAAGIEAEPLAWTPAGVMLGRGVNVESLPGFDRGWVSVQDASAQLLPGVIGAAAPKRILDACAAPGGKLTHLLESFPDASLQALESDPQRAPRIRDNLDRLGLEAEVAVADASRLADWWDGRPFDLVVLDAPCSGTGVIRRHPDIKLLRRAADIARFAALQQRLLESLWQTLRPGGRLIYITCSILEAENQKRIESFLDHTPDSREQPVHLPAGVMPGHGCQILPARRGGDGFYYADLRKG